MQALSDLRPGVPGRADAPLSCCFFSKRNVQCILPGTRWWLKAPVTAVSVVCNCRVCTFGATREGVLLDFVFHII